MMINLQANRERQNPVPSTVFFKNGSGSNDYPKSLKGKSRSTCSVKFRMGKRWAPVNNKLDDDIVCVSTTRYLVQKYLQK